MPANPAAKAPPTTLAFTDLHALARSGGDDESDARPSPVDGVHSPVHALALTALGIVLLDNLDLEALYSACAAHGPYTFLLAVAPLVVPRGTGSPVNPIAVR